MTNPLKAFFRLAAPLCFLLIFSGCAALPFAVPAALSGGAAGVNYSFTNIAYKTISHPSADVEAALHEALKKMNIREVKREAAGELVSVTAATAHLDIYIDIEKVTPSLTNIKVNAKRGPFFKDKATAAEIIVQTMENLDGK